jgi:hypothetical protein
MVELVLDLAGYVPERPLANLLAVEPAAGDGAFLQAMVRRLVQSCRRNGTPLCQARTAIGAFEVDPQAADRAINAVCSTLVDLGTPVADATAMARHWVRTDDFLESSLPFPVVDFVIGNPPYIRLEEAPEAKAASYRKGYSAMQGRADVYVAFYQAALLQLKQGGVCAFICSDRWMLNEYGSALRNLITTQGFNVRYVVESHHVDAFESSVAAYPAVTIIANEKQGPAVVAKALPGIESVERKSVTDALAGVRPCPFLSIERFPEWFHGREPWPCASFEALQFLKRLESSCNPLESSSTGTQIGIGVATGADRVFITDAKPDVEPDRLLPLAMASDLKAGRVQWSGHFLVNPWNERGLVRLSEYPLLETYLKPHYDLLTRRHTAKGRPLQWHKTIDRVNLDLLGKEKLYIADIKDRLLPSLDVGETYPQHNLYWITSTVWDLRVLGGLLMSAVGEFFIQCYGVRMRGGYLRFQAQYLRRIRVPDPASISPALARALRLAFETQDVDLATQAAFEAYQIEGIPL